MFTLTAKIAHLTFSLINMFYKWNVCRTNSHGGAASLPSTAPWQRSMTARLACAGGWPHLPAPSGCDGDPRPAWWKCCLLIQTKRKKQNSKRDTLIRGEINTQLLCSSICIWPKGSDAARLTLRSHGVRDWTGVTEAVSIHCSDHKQVDSSRLQVPQDKGLCLYMLSQGDPSAA